jgi:hypothetical protein
MDKSVHVKLCVCVCLCERDSFAVCIVASIHTPGLMFVCALFRASGCLNGAGFVHKCVCLYVCVCILDQSCFLFVYAYVHICSHG